MRTSRTTAQNKRIYAMAAASLVLAAAIAIFAFVARQQGQRDFGLRRVEIPHLHGLGYSSDGLRLMVPAHIGLLVYENNQWFQPDLPKHDYMGFSPIDTGFFSSGHPDLRTEFESLLGLVKSEDGGQSIMTLAFEGESDFHLLAAGYRSHAVYVVNSSPNSELQEGLYYTLDEGNSWQRSAAQGLSSAPIQIAAHPDESDTVAVATERGLWLSTDYGDTFELVSASEPVTAVTFDLQSNSLYFGYQQLYQFDLETGEVTTVAAPPLADNDAFSYIATNPVSGTRAAATYERDVFVSADGISWTQIADNGTGS
jgi:hypothetical protein